MRRNAWILLPKLWLARIENITSKFLGELSVALCLICNGSIINYYHL